MSHYTVLYRAVASLFFGGGAIIFAGLSVWFMYETAAVWTRIVPTISEVTAFELLKHPIWWITTACMVCFALGALVTHFSHWTPIP